MTITDSDQQRGLYGKYRVEKVNGKPIGRCFVLDYDNDEHARVALEAYADSCESEFPALAADLYRQLGIDYSLPDGYEVLSPELVAALTEHYGGMWVAINKQAIVGSAPSLRVLRDQLSDRQTVTIFRVTAKGEQPYGT